MTNTDVDPRLIQGRPGITGAARDYGRRLAQGDLGSLPGFLGLVIVCGYFGWRHDRFLSGGNITNLTLQMVPVGIITVGIMLVLLVGEIDLSVGAVSGFAAASMAVLSSEHGWSAPLALGAGVVLGALVGLLQGSWVTFLRVPAVIVTLAGLVVWQGALVEVLGSTGSVNLTSPGVLRLTGTFYGPGVTWSIAIGTLAVMTADTLISRSRRTAAGLPVTPLIRPILKLGAAAAVLVAAAGQYNRDRGLPLAVLILLVIVLVVSLVLGRTKFGRHLYAVGGNADAARRAGIPVQRIRVTAFVLASTLAAMGGLMEASRSRRVSTSWDSNDFLLFALAGAVIGGISLFGGRGSAAGALLGVVVVGAIQNGMILLQVESSVRFIITGCVLLVAATIDAVSRHVRAAAGRASPDAMSG